MKKTITLIKYYKWKFLWSIITLSITVFLSFPLLFPSLKISHYIHLKIHWNDKKYEKLIEYKKICWESCIVREEWRWCHEWKKCYRKSENEEIIELLDDYNLWRIIQIEDKLTSVIHQNSISDFSISSILFFYWWYDYHPDWTYFYWNWDWEIDLSSLNQAWRNRTKHIYWNWYFKLSSTYYSK